MNWMMGSRGSIPLLYIEIREPSRGRAAPLGSSHFAADPHRRSINLWVFDIPAPANRRK